MGTQMIIRRFTVGRYPINGYLVADAETRMGVFIAPGGFHEEIAVYIAEQRIELRDIFFTHGHWDHVEGLGGFTQRYSVQSYAPAGEVPAANHNLCGGEELNVGKLRFATFSTPGHTKAAISFYCQDCLFSGDALFCGSVGGTAGPEQAREQLDHVKRQLFTLPDNTLVYPGHGPMTTIAAEKYGNPFFRDAGPVTPSGSARG